MATLKRAYGQKESEMSETFFDIWTDGACEPNPGLGGWGYMRRCASGTVIECFGGEARTTNNRMELTAILEALKSLPDGACALVYSDSKYCVNGLTIWHPGWKRKNWMKGGHPMLNRDLWMALDAQCQRVRPMFRWVRGHNGNAGNERADTLASMGRLQALGVRQ